MELNLNLDESEKENEENESSNNNINKAHKSNNNINENTENDLNRNMFEFNTVIGKGGFGKVWKVQYKKTNEYFALKEMSKRKILDKKSEKSINSERKFLSILNHPFIVNMHYAFQDNDNLYLVMDMLSGGDLRYHCSRYRSFSEEQTRFFIACITYSLEYIHSNNVIHRDIKPENLVLDDKGYVRVTDFGIVKYNTADNSSETSGTPGYMSPEVMNAENHSFTADFFAIGVIGYEFLMGFRPYNGKTRKEIKEKIFGEKVEITLNQKKKGWSDDVIDFINKLLERNKDLRLGANKGFQELKEHQWLKYYPWDELEQKILPAPFVPEEIDNFDKSYCESEEKITQETKLRYKKIYSSNTYKIAFVDFYFNKDIDKYQRKQVKSKKVKNIIKNEENNNENKNENMDEKNTANNNVEEIFISGKDEIIDKNNNNNSLDKLIKSNENDIKNIAEMKNKNELSNNSNKNNIINLKNGTNEIAKTEGEILVKKIMINSEGNKTKIIENSNTNNIESFNSLHKTNDDKKYVNQFNTNNIIQINNFKKIIINHNDYLKKKSSPDNFLKEYIKYQNNPKKQNKLNTKYNYLFKIKKVNKFQKNKNSSVIFNSSNKDNNNSDYFINNQFPKKEEYNKYENKTIIKHFLLYNNSITNAKGNITNNLIVKNNNNYNRDRNQIKYSKLKIKKKNNNSFRINHIQSLFKGEKMSMIKKLYLAPSNDRNDSLSKRLEKNNLGKTYLNMNSKFSEKNIKKIKKREGKSSNKNMPKLPIYYNSGDNSENYNSYKMNNITNFKLIHTNNDFSIKYANSLNNINNKDKSFNFNKNIQKFQSSEKNTILNKNYINNKSRSNTNIKSKRFDRINSAGKFKNNRFKIDKENSVINNMKKNSNDKLNNMHNSNKRDKYNYYLIS